MSTPDPKASDPVSIIGAYQTKDTMRFEITCPALGETEHTDDLDRAWDLCFDMYQESGSYACVRSMLGDVIGDYGAPLDWEA